MGTITISSAGSFGNTLLSLPFTRECSVGQYGSVVNFVVSANSFFAPSQEEADAAALAYAMTNGQAYANNPANGGTCVSDQIISFNLNGSASDVPGIVGTFSMRRAANGGEVLASRAIDVDNSATVFRYKHSTTPILTSFYVQIDITTNSLVGDLDINLYDFANTNLLGTITIPAGDTGSFTYFEGAEYTGFVVNGEFDLGFTVTRSRDFQKNNCTGGGIGTIETYSKEYIGVDEAAANAAADMDASNFNIEGQAWANTVGTCKAPLPSDAVGILVIDLYNDVALETCAYVSTLGMTPSMVPVYKNGNNFLPNDGTPAANCWALASDLAVGGGSLVYRYEFNIARMINTYGTTIPVFEFEVRGRSNVDNTVSGLTGAYSLKGADAGNMSMGGSPGTYMPSTVGATNIGLTGYTGKPYYGGANGSIGVDVGNVILTFRYTVATKSLILL